MLLQHAELVELEELAGQLEERPASGCTAAFAEAFRVGWAQLAAQLPEEDADIYDVDGTAARLQLIAAPLGYALRTGQCMSETSEAMQRGLEAARRILNPPQRNWGAIILGAAGAVCGLAWLFGGDDAT